VNDPRNRAYQAVAPSEGVHLRVFTAPEAEPSENRTSASLMDRSTERSLTGEDQDGGVRLRPSERGTDFTLSPAVFSRRILTYFFFAPEIYPPRDSGLRNHVGVSRFA